jgi:hypothetical protein
MSILLTSCFQLAWFSFDCEDGGRTYFLPLDEITADYTASHSRRIHSSLTFANVLEYRKEGEISKK